MHSQATITTETIYISYIEGQDCLAYKLRINEIRIDKLLSSNSIGKLTYSSL